MLISSIHYVTRLNGQTQSALSGTAETQEREKSEFRGSHLKWSLPNHYHVDAFIQRGVSVKIVRLSTDGNSQRDVAMMVGLSQGCISKFLRRNRETGRPHQRKRGDSMKISTLREDRQMLRMVRTNRFISAPRLWMQMIRRFGRQMLVRTIRRRLLTAGYWSRRPARCPRFTLGHRRRPR